MTGSQWLSTALLSAGCAFYLAGTVGMLRFPDTLSRLHALTKADNVGLFLVCLSLAVRTPSLRLVVLLGLVWGFGLLAASVSAHLIARHFKASGDQ